MKQKKQKSNKVKRALITGITGQDGSYLAELLLKKGYEVHGIVRRSSSFNRGRIEHLTDTEFDPPSKLILHYGDLSDLASLVYILQKSKPDEIYNLAAQSHVLVSFENPLYTAHVDAIGVLNILEAVRILNLPAKIYQASTSELYSGDPKEAPQDEKTPFNPKSPYGVAKLYAYHIARIYRESYGMFVVNGILFNHESERRAEHFVTRKITLGVGKIVAGEPHVITLGNLDAKRDWGHAEDSVRAMHLMLQQDKPEDYVIATGEQHSVREFAELAFKLAGIDLVWKGKGINEKGIDKKTGRVLVKVDPRHFRPNEVHSLWGKVSKAKEKLGWKPEVSFEELVGRMVKGDRKKKK